MTPFSDNRRRPRTAPALLLLAALAGLLWSSPAAMAGNEAEDGGGWYAAPQIKRLTNSHTSYEFGNPYQRALSPLSRLEFPLNSWWGGMGLGYRGPRYALGLTLLMPFPGQDDLGVMRDSDWTDENRPRLKTVYSESTVKLKDSLDLDGRFSLSLAEALGLPAWLDLRPLLGVRWQRFVFVTRDGAQQELETDPGAPGGERWTFLPLPGEGLWFRQEYLHAYAGLGLTADLGALGLGEKGRGWRLEMQGDLAQVYGENRDRHLLRGDRVTTERTQGHALHGSLGLRAPLFAWASLVLTGEYMVIETRGDHTLSVPSQNTDLTWDYGVRVWSRQAGLSLALEIPF